MIEIIFSNASFADMPVMHSLCPYLHSYGVLNVWEHGTQSMSFFCIITASLPVGLWSFILQGPAISTTGTFRASAIYMSPVSAPITMESLFMSAGSSSRFKAPQSLCGAFNLEELPAAIKRLSLVIGADTGLIYMADALNVPVVDIAGPCNMNDQRPTGKDAVIIQKKDIDCVPCSHTFKTPYECRYGHRECITGISANEAFEKIISIIYTNDV